MNKKIIILVILLLFNVAYIFLNNDAFNLYELKEEDLLLNILYTSSITFVSLIFLILLRSYIKNYLDFIDDTISILNFKILYRDLSIGFLAFIFFLSIGYVSKVNTLKNETKYIIGVIVKKSNNARVEGYSIKLKNNKNELELYPSYKAWKDLKTGKLYKIKTYKGWLGIDYYYKDSFDIKEIK